MSLKMRQTRIPWRTWVLACDGAKALIFQNEGDSEWPNLKLIDTITQEQPPTHELGAERPGRVFQSHGAARSAVEQTDWHMQNEATFLARVAEKLDQAAQKHSFKHIVIAAPPRALGMLRQKITPKVRALVFAELAKDLAQMSTNEIERHFV
jgi:protein required for attachment to host cells